MNGNTLAGHRFNIHRESTLDLVRNLYLNHQERETIDASCLTQTSIFSGFVTFDVDHIRSGTAYDDSLPRANQSLF